MSNVKNILARLKCMIIRPQVGARDNYDFPSVSKWLNSLTIKQCSFSLLFEHGQTWIVLESGVQVKYVDQYNSITNILITKGRYEEKELALVCRNLSTGAVFFDVGANVGVYSLSVAWTFDTVEIHAFEPVPEIICEFKDNLSRNHIDSSKITINPLAVGDVDGWVFITTDYHSSNYITDSHSEQKRIRVRCTTLDNYVKEKAIKRLDSIKIDVEGRELAVLKGAKETLKRFRPIVLVELFEKPSNFFDRKVDGFRETINFMLNLGYEYYVIDDNQNLIHMDNLEAGEFNWSYHNYLFYLDDVKIG